MVVIAHIWDAFHPGGTYNPPPPPSETFRLEAQEGTDVNDFVTDSGDYLMYQDPTP